MLQQNLQWLAVPLKHGEHEKRQHDDDHERCRHADADGSLGQEEHRHADQGTEPEADNLTFGQIEQKLGFDLGQILGNRYICHGLSSFSTQTNTKQESVSRFDCCFDAWASACAASGTSFVVCLLLAKRVAKRVYEYKACK